MKNAPLLLCLIALCGCATLSPTGPYAGNQALYNADLAITTSYTAFHTFVKWEYDNRPALAPWPEVRKAADTVRRDSRGWIESAIRCREAYASNLTQDNAAKLNQAISILRAALTEATKYLAAHERDTGT